MDHQQLVDEQYGTQPLVTRVEAALRSADLAERSISWTDLVPLDQFHVGGLGASRELAEALGIERGATLLDVGCGLGGPARFLAATCGAQVTGIDLSRSFVETAQLLTQRCGMTGTVTIQQANALDLPFADANFDLAWTQHVAMNIADRTRLYAGLHRVLKSGGKLAIYDVIAGDGRPLIFPVPWARRPELSFLLTSNQMKATLATAGFTELTWTDKTEEGIAWFNQMRSKQSAGMHALGIHVVMGNEFASMAANLGRNFQEGRARIVQTIVQRS
jgi:SAM-dependent methyltransferase